MFLTCKDKLGRFAEFVGFEGVLDKELIGKSLDYAVTTTCCASGVGWQGDVMSRVIG